MTDKLPLDAKIGLIDKMIRDLKFYTEAGDVCPTEQQYKVVSRDEDLGVERVSRFAALKNMNAPLRKVAFDTRRVDQVKDRNPRRNLQQWHRSEDFIDKESKDKVEIFSKLDSVVKRIKEDLATEPEWFDSYARALSSNLDRVQLKRAGDKSVEVFKPHIKYLEQLIYNRYRLTLNDIKEASAADLRKTIMSKDEDLQKRGEFLMSTGGFNKEDTKKTADAPLTKGDLETLAEVLSRGNNGAGAPIIIQQPKQEEQAPKDAAGALFGAPLRRAGEKSVERTITIKIIDSVVE